MKKFLSLVLLLLMVVSFAACSSNNAVNETEKETVSNKTEDKKDNVNGSAGENTNTETENSEDNSEISDNEKNVENTTETPGEEENNGGDNKEPDKETENNSNKTLGNKLLDEFKAVAENAGAFEIAEKLSTYSELGELSLEASEIEPGFLAGFDNAEIKGFKKGATFAPMIGTIPFVGYVFELEEGADVSAFIKTLTSNANPRWNVCTEAEETVTGNVGNKVFFVMCNKSVAVVE